MAVRIDALIAESGVRGKLLAHGSMCEHDGTRGCLDDLHGKCRPQPGQPIDELSLSHSVNNWPDYG